LGTQVTYSHQALLVAFSTLFYKNPGSLLILFLSIFKPFKAAQRRETHSASCQQQESSKRHDEKPQRKRVEAHKQCNLLEN